MVELLRQQNLKMVKLRGTKYGYQSLCLKIFAAPKTPRPILTFRVTLCIKLTTYDIYFLNFDILEKLTKITEFQIFLKFRSPKYQKHLFLHLLEEIFLKMVEFLGLPWKLVGRHPPGHPRFLCYRYILENISFEWKHKLKKSSRLIKKLHFNIWVPNGAKQIQQTTPCLPLIW